MSKIAVILFPGTNCENETARAVEAAGVKADIVDLGIHDLSVSPAAQTGVCSVRTSQVYLLTGDMSMDSATLLARELTTDPTTQEFAVNTPLLSAAIAPTEGQSPKGDCDASDAGRADRASTSCEASSPFAIWCSPGRGAVSTR